MDRKKKVFGELAVFLVGMFFLSCLFWLTNLDIFLQDLFFKPQEGWYLGEHPLLTFIYDFGPVLPLLIFLVALLILVLGLFIKPFRKYRKIALFIVLLIFIGSGFITNFLLKDHWGRPRPREIIRYGGEYPFLHHWLIGDSGKNSSFPSGHASIGFAMIFPYFLYRNKNVKKARFFLVLGVVYGLILGITRMIQGGHFASDVVWAGALMYLSGLFLYYLLKMDKHSHLE